MEGYEGLTEPSEQNKGTPWFADFADNLCAYYMFIGVPFHEYWFGDYSQFHYYEDVDRLREKHENYGSWLQGRYVYEAVGALTPLLHAFAKSGTKAAPYLSEPYPLTKEDQAEQEEREARRKQEIFKEKTKTWAMKVNAHFAKGGGSDGGVHD